MAASDLLSVAAAVARIRAVTDRLPAVTLPARDALGLVLDQDLAWPGPVPALAVSAMDGVALASTDGAAGRVLEVAGTTWAGQPPGPPLGPGQGRRIMTGAPLPPGADAVQRVEHTEPAGPDRLRLVEGVQPGENVRAAGSERRRGEAALAAGTLLTPVHAGLLAALGRDQVRVIRRPRVAVAATGDELAPAGRPVEPWRIWNSNGPLLAALVRGMGAEATDLGILPDRQADLGRAVAGARREHDLILLSGGVSRGDLDLVTTALPAAGLAPVFHGVAVKPGKPLLFAADGRGAWAFGLPGNPLSTLVGFLLFVAPALARLANRPDPVLELRARLRDPVRRRDGEREEYRPARLWASSEGTLQARAAPVASSADLGAATAANALLRLPMGCMDLAAGALVDVLQPPPLAGLAPRAGG